MQHTSRLASFLTAATLLASAPGVAVAQPGAGHAAHISGSAKLKARAKVSGDSATKIARAQVPNGTIRSGEIEEERGKLIYSFDIKVPGKSGIEEVNVDAITGQLVAHEHEGPAAERAEARQDAKAQAHAAKQRPTP